MKQATIAFCILGVLCVGALLLALFGHVGGVDEAHVADEEARDRGIQRPEGRNDDTPPLITDRVEVEVTGSQPAESRRHDGARLINLDPVATPRVAGRIVDEAGDPVVGAKVILSTTTRSEATTSSRDGSYELETSWVFGTRLPRLTATHPGFMPSQKSLDYDKLVGRPKRLEHDLILRPGGMLTGRVMGRINPAVGAVVSVIPEQEGISKQRLRPTDGSGRFFVSVKPGLYRLMINHGELGFAEKMVECQDTNGVDVGDILLSQGTMLRAHLTYPDGQNVEQLSLHVHCVDRTKLDATKGAATWRTWTDSGGSFCLYGMTPGSYKVIPRGTAVPGFRKRPPVIQSGNQSNEVEIPLHRVRVTFRLKGNPRRVPHLGVIVKWTEQLPPGEKPRHRQAPWFPNEDRLVLPGSIWKIEARFRDASGSAIVDTSSSGGYETLVEVVLAPSER
ncbi:MAG: carboxypeptidase-like regulatory domain-containing protein [Planctomycetota bacterium]